MTQTAIQKRNHLFVGVLQEFLHLVHLTRAKYLLSPIELFQHHSCPHEHSWLWVLPLPLFRRRPLGIEHCALRILNLGLYLAFAQLAHLLSLRR
jgi:hypothetical protein